MFAVRITGVKEVQTRLAALASGSKTRILAPAMTEGAQYLAAKVSERAPKLTGAMAESVYVSTVAQDEGGLRVSQESPVGYVIVEKFYARFVEYGSPHQAAHPFVRPVIEADSEQYTHVVTSLVWEFTKFTLSSAGSAAMASAPWQLRLALQIEVMIARSAIKAITG